MAFPALLTLLAPILGDVIRRVVPDKEKQAELETQLQLELMNNQHKLEEISASIVKAEANSEGVLARNWRPTVMLGFFGLIASYWFGITADYLSEAVVTQMFSLLEIGLGGYVIGRSVEKVATTLTGTGVVGNAQTELAKWRESRR
jgi:hypothetical protein